MSELEPSDFELERAEDGGYCCPVETCEKTFGSPIVVTRHYGLTDDPDHDRSIPIELVGDVWKRYLEEQSARGRSARDIATDLPDHIGRGNIKRDKERFDIRTETVPYTGTAATLLARPDITTIEKAREVAKKQRGVR